MGWHIYNKKPYKSISWPNDTMRKVYYRNVAAEGMQAGNGVIVAKEIFIVPKRLSLDKSIPVW